MHLEQRPLNNKYHKDEDDNVDNANVDSVEHDYFGSLWKIFSVKTKKPATEARAYLPDGKLLLAPVQVTPIMTTIMTRSVMSGLSTDMG